MLIATHLESHELCQHWSLHPSKLLRWFFELIVCRRRFRPTEMNIQRVLTLSTLLLATMTTLATLTTARPNQLKDTDDTNSSWPNWLNIGYDLLSGSGVICCLLRLRVSTFRHLASNCWTRETSYHTTGERRWGSFDTRQGLHSSTSWRNSAETRWW